MKKWTREHKEGLFVGAAGEKGGEGGEQRTGCRSHRKERKLPTERFLTASFPPSLTESHRHTQFCS